MKKLNLFLVLVLGLVLTVFTSCEKDDPIIPEKEPVEENVVEPSDLVGDWGFTSLEFEGETYYGCDPYLNQDYLLVTFEFLDVTETTLKMYSNCHDGEGPWKSGDFNYLIENENLLIKNYHGDLTTEFKILNFREFDGKTLKLEFTWDIGSNVPINGIYVLTKK